MSELTFEVKDVFKLENRGNFKFYFQLIKDRFLFFILFFRKNINVDTGSDTIQIITLKIRHWNIMAKGQIIKTFYICVYSQMFHT